jgi:hypothetical protein
VSGPGGPLTCHPGAPARTKRERGASRPRRRKKHSRKTGRTQKWEEVGDLFPGKGPKRESKSACVCVVERVTQGPAKLGPPAQGHRSPLVPSSRRAAAPRRPERRRRRHRRPADTNPRATSDSRPDASAIAAHTSHALRRGRAAKSPSRQVAKSPSHQVTKSPSHQVVWPPLSVLGGGAGGGGGGAGRAAGGRWRRRRRRLVAAVGG